MKSQTRQRAAKENPVRISGKKNGKSRSAGTIKDEPANHDFHHPHSFLNPGKRVESRRPKTAR